MTVRWYYDTSGRPAYYRQGDHLYDAAGSMCFFASNGYWYEDGTPRFFEREAWVYSIAGTASFYHSEV